MENRALQTNRHKVNQFGEGGWTKGAETWAGQLNLDFLVSLKYRVPKSLRILEKCISCAKHESLFICR